MSQSTAPKPPARQRRRMVDTLSILAYDPARREFDLILNRRNRQNDLTESSELGWIPEQKLRAVLAAWQKQLDVIDGKVTLIEQLGIKLS